MNYICPSLLSANFTNLESDIKLCEEAGVDMLHIDIMDGHFVPNITIGQPVVKSIKKVTNLPLDCHLMINKPELQIQSFAEAGADIITVHAEAVIHLHRIIKQIKSFGCKAGISLVPTTHENILDYIIEDLDLILVMTVNPGFGGQNFINSQLEKVQNIRNKINTSNNKNILLQVDGGINLETGKMAKQKGANSFVAGNFLFEDRSQFVIKANALKNL